MAASNDVPSNPFVSAETLMARALIGLRLLAAEGEAGPGGDMWRQGCPQGQAWISSCSASETSLGCEVYEHNNECQAIEVILQDWSSEVVALFLEDREFGRVALSCHMAMDLLCQEMRDACWDSSESPGSPCSLCSVSERFSCRRVRGMCAWKVNCHCKQKPFCDNKGEGCGERRRSDISF